MKIYFAGSIRGGRDDKEIYLKMINFLQEFGEVLTEHVGNVSLDKEGEYNNSDIYIYNRDISWLKESDVIIAEVTNPSLGVGYEIAFAEKLNKKVICLFREKENRKLSAMLKGNNNLITLQYKDITDFKNIIIDYI